MDVSFDYDVCAANGHGWVDGEEMKGDGYEVERAYGRCRRFQAIPNPWGARFICLEIEDGRWGRRRGWDMWRKVITYERQLEMFYLPAADAGDLDVLHD